MTPKQFMSRLKTLLSSMVWSETSNKVLSSVYVVPQVPIQQITQFRTPCCFLVDNGFNQDTEHPGLLYQLFTLVFFVENVQNNMGESVLLGEGRVENTSLYAGLYDIEEEVISKIINTYSLTTKVIINELTGIKTKVVPKNNPLIFRSWHGSVITSLY